MANRNTRRNALRWSKQARRLVKATAAGDKPMSYVQAYSQARAGLLEPRL
jgi:hypothetical protein